MTLSQRKIDLAVLYKLYQHAERNAEAPTPTKLAGMFADPIFSVRRIEVSLGELETRGQGESFADPSAGVYRWQITREGLGVVDRAIKVPTSFIGRLHANGDKWLETDEARQAVLKKLPDPSVKTGISVIQPEVIVPPPTTTLSGIDWGKWGAIAGIIAIPIAIALWYFS